MKASDLLTKTYPKVDVAQSVAKLISAMVKYKEGFALVFDKDKYIGLVSKKWLLDTRVDPDQMKVKNILKHRSRAKSSFFVPKLSSSTALKRMCQLFVNSDSRALPVMEKGKVLGVVRARDAVKALDADLGHVPAAELASVPAITISEKETINTALNIMSRKGIDRLPVVDKLGKLVGIASLFDIIDRFHAPGGKTRMHVPSAASHQQGKRSGYDIGEKTNVGQHPILNVVTHFPLVYTVPKDAKLHDALQLMAKKDLSSVILIEDEKPAGILTVKDVMSEFVKG